MDGRPRQQVIIPVTGSIDIKPVEAIINHPLHRKSYFRKQLGLAHVEYPGAQHMRAEHELGSYELAHRRAQRWFEAGMISKEDAIALRVLGLIHDDPHGPYSHITDPLVTNDHNERAAPIIEQMADAISQAGADPERIIKLMARKDPLAQGVLHTPLGVEKIDYLARDSYHSGIAGMLDVGPFLEYVYFDGEKIVADVMIQQLVTSLVNHYWTMYDQCYYVQAVVIVERFMQRMISMLLGQYGGEAEISEDELIGMVDSELDVRLEFAKNPTVSADYQRYLNGEVPTVAILLQLDPHQKANWTPQQTVAHLPAGEEVFAERMRNPQLLSRLEAEIEKLVGLPGYSVLATPAAPKRRFQPPEIFFQTNGGVIHFRDLNPIEWSAALAKARAHARFYIATEREHQKKVSDPLTAQAIVEIITRYAEG